VIFPYPPGYCGEEQEVPFSRFKQDSTWPTLELYLPSSLEGNGMGVETIVQRCGTDLLEAFTGLSPFDPLNSKAEDRDFLPLVKDLPRPELALNQGPIYVRLIETLSDGNKGAFEVDGPPDVLELLRDYICKHARDRYNSTSFYHWLRPHRLGEAVSVLRITDSQFSVSSLIIPCLLESNLGFKSVGDPVATNGKVIWLFRRDKPFKLR
jgi:hypothetical protein